MCPCFIRPEEWVWMIVMNDQRLQSMLPMRLVGEEGKEVCSQQHSYIHIVKPS
jgi:hypothetical protein